jgi:hypothetical protein
MVGVTGLEPATSASRTRRSTRLSYTPKQAPSGGRRLSAALDPLDAPPERLTPDGGRVSPRLRHAPIIRKNLRSKAFDRARRFDGSTGALDPSGTTSRPEAGASRRPKAFGRAPPAIEGVRSRSSLMRIHRILMSSVPDRSSPYRRSTGASHPRWGPGLAQTELHPAEADLSPAIHDVKTNRGSKLGGGSRFPPDRPTLPPGTVQPHGYRARPPLPVRRRV